MGEVCKPKSKGGLGVKDVHSFNLALLGKWNWRLMNDCDMLNSKCGHGFSNLSAEGSIIHASKKSAWVKDLDGVIHKNSVIHHWFQKGIVRKVGDGSSTRFWHDNWSSDANFFSRFRRLYNLSTLQNGHISDFGSWISDNWKWNLPWICHIYDTSKLYSVRSAYNLLSTYDQPQPIAFQHFHLIWKSKAPLKITTFVWGLFQDRLPTKDALHRGGIPLNHGGGFLCVLCSEYPESSQHLFSSCNIIYYLKISGALPDHPNSHFITQLGM
ncbi:hypothetical protein Lal_00017042, partial [Lupinus albus]